MLHLDYLYAILDADVRAYRAGAADPRLRLGESGALTVDYAPFDHIERGAELVIAGLTPGRVQAANAIEAMAKALGRGDAPEAALAWAKRSASFSGPMRANLTSLLDAIGLPALYGHARAADFFADQGARVHFTSVLRYPVFVGGANYSGAPSPLRHPLLRAMIDRHLIAEIAALPRASWVPLGRHAEAVMLQLAREGLIDRSRILAGLPHPSGANAERIAYFLGRKPRAALSRVTDPDALDAAKEQLRLQVIETAARRRLA